MKDSAEFPTKASVLVTPIHLCNPARPLRENGIVGGHVINMAAPYSLNPIL
jgi:hypothetical protein